MVMLSPGTPGPLGPAGGSRTDPRGRFTIGGVPSGTYRIHVSRPMTTTSGGGFVSSSSTIISSSGNVVTSYATGSSSSQQETVTGADANVTGVRILLVLRP
jgi:hypothetical protein